MDRRTFLLQSARALGAIVGGGALGAAIAGGSDDSLVWQIDPDKCIACGNCATACVLTPSAVKVVHDVDICGFCDLCFGFFAEQRPGDTEAAENQRCPTGAIIRNFVEEPYYEYMIDETKCIGCATCVEGCSQYGNGALIMQVRHDRCVNCNECAIAAQCPADAFVRVPADDPYLLRSKKLEEEAAEEQAGAGPLGRETEPSYQPPPQQQPPPWQPTREQSAAGQGFQPEPVSDQAAQGTQPAPEPQPHQPPPAAGNGEADSLQDLIGGDLR